MRRPEEIIDLVDQPTEEASVDGFGESISTVHTLGHCVVPDDHLASGHHTGRGQRHSQLFRVHPKQLGHWNSIGHCRVKVEGQYIDQYIGDCRDQGRGSHRGQYIGYCRGQYLGQYKGQHSGHNRRVNWSKVV